MALIGGRYQLLEQLGKGGMGEVYRALDRLTGEAVALKRVLPARDLLFSPYETEHLQMAITREFQVLASLRHPHIISVLDYGVDQQPYFTMTLLENPTSLRDAAAEQDEAGKLQWLIEILQALAYLHRWGIVHRDLKPANILIDAQGQLKVLDFGLASDHRFQEEPTGDTAGTLLYMAPEVLNEDAHASIASDLYAVGVIAYEMLTGAHPFVGLKQHEIIENILFKTPDLALLPPALRPVIEQLLAKNPLERLPDAESAIQALSAGQAPESRAVRESFLQAARFVGREAELQQLTEALGAGGLWLIGGESGVGKSRLLDELRIRAMVAGTPVLRGQAVQGGGLPYHPWREILRRLCLTSALNELEAAILQPLVPDIERLLERSIPPAPPLDGEAGKRRLWVTVAEVLRRQTQPLVLLLEDIQWSEESLELLRHLQGLKVLLVATYSSEERADLPSLLPSANTLRLERFSKTAIHALSQSMLGEVDEALLDLLHQETEGNAFFLVEVVRILAEEAGRLSAVGRQAIPAQVTAGGILQVVRRRLERLAPENHPLLHYAALLGRELDLKLFEAGLALDRFLLEGSQAMVLEVLDDQWRFSHNKLREMVLAGIPAEERPALQRRAAQALEHVYGEARAAALADHWQEAGETGKAAHYARLAGEQALAISQFRAAIAWFERALPASADPMGLYWLLGEAQRGLSNFAAAEEFYAKSLGLALAQPQPAPLAAAYLGLSSVAVRLGAYDSAELYAQQSLALYEQLQDQRGVAHSQLVLGQVAFDRAAYPQAAEHLELGLALSQQIGDVKNTALILKTLGSIAAIQARYEAAVDFYTRSREMSRQLGDQQGMAAVLNNLGIVSTRREEMRAAERYLKDSLEISRRIGDQQTAANALTNLSNIAWREREFALARIYQEDAIGVYRQIGARWGLTAGLCNLLFTLLALGEVEPAQQALQEGLVLAREMDAQNVVLEFVAGYATLQFKRGNPTHSAELYGLVAAHPQVDNFIQVNRLQPLYGELEQALSPADLNTAQEHGKTLVFEEVLGQLGKT